MKPNPLNGAKYALFLFILTSVVGSCHLKSKESNQPGFLNPSYQLVWSDEFNYTGLPDSSKWSYSTGDGISKSPVWRNSESQYYTENRLKNARVVDGILTIEAHYEKIEGHDFSSAQLSTKDKADWKYGRIEVRAKLPKHKGISSAIWMMPSDTSLYGSWPQCGEIDIMKGIALDSIETAAITGNYYFGGDTLNHTRLHFLNSDNKFHTYVLEWEENEYRVYADSIHYFTFINERKGFMTWPFDQSFYLILNIACEANVGATEDIVEKELPQKMEIDYVRVYQIET